MNNARARRCDFVGDGSDGDDNDSVDTQLGCDVLGHTSSVWVGRRQRVPSFPSVEQWEDMGSSSAGQLEDMGEQVKVEEEDKDKAVGCHIRSRHGSLSSTSKFQ